MWLWRRIPSDSMQLKCVAYEGIGQFDENYIVGVVLTKFIRTKWQASGIVDLEDGKTSSIGVSDDIIYEMHENKLFELNGTVKYTVISIYS